MNLVGIRLKIASAAHHLAIHLERGANMRKPANQVGALLRFLAVAAVIGNTLFAVSVSADTPATPGSTEQELRAVEAQLAQALSSVDVDQLARLWADDFISTMVGGQVVSREKRLASLRGQKPDTASSLIGTNERVDVRVYGDWAVVLVTSSWLSNGKRVGDPYQATHVWAKRGGRWRLVAAHISEVHP
jgi:ketosteroid isomerase-like protein